MNNSFRKTFYSSLLAVLLVISNLVGVKYTNLGGLVLSVNFVTFPFIFLCLLLITNICNKKEANISLVTAVLVQVFILLSYLLVTNLGAQNIIPDFANYVNIVFKIDEVYIIINLIAILVSSFILQYIYDYFIVIGYKFFGALISILSSIILYGFITIPIINYGFGMSLILDIIMGHLIMSCFMTVLIIILFYLLKDREYHHDEEKVFVKDIKLGANKNKKDKPIEEVIKIVDKKTNKMKKQNVNKTVNKKKDAKKNVNK